MTEVPSPDQRAANFPATDPEPRVGLFRLPWWRWPYVIVPLVALAMVLGAAAWAFPGLLARLQLGDYRTSERQVREFNWPAGLHDDPTLTACGEVVTRCARSDVTPEAALRAALPALAEAGLELGPLQCGAEADTGLPWRQRRQFDCAAFARKSGFFVQAFATEYPQSAPGLENVRLGYTQVSVVVTAEGPRLATLVVETSAPGTRAPLPPRAADVPGLPTLLRSLECAQPEGEGCRTFDGIVALPGVAPSSIDATAATLADDLRAGGYYLQTSICRDVDAGRRCTVSALLFRAAGGNDFTSVVAIVSNEKSGGLSIQANVTAP
jgi:hypothetical protein